MNSVRVGAIEAGIQTYWIDPEHGKPKRLRTRDARLG